MTTQNYVVEVNGRSDGSTADAWHDTEIDVNEGDLLTFQASGEVRPWPIANGDIGFTGPDGYYSHGYNITPPVLPSARFMSLVGGIGDIGISGYPAYEEDGGEVFYIGSNQTIAAPTTGRLWLIVNDVRDAFGDNDDTAFTVNISVRLGGPYEPQNQGECPAFITNPESGPNPINLRNGEKTLTEMDLSLQTPAGPLNFTRIYRQYQQNNPDYQTLLGLGWTHNHAFKLDITGSSPTRVAHVRWADGSILTLDEVATPAGRFNARAGSIAYMQSNGSSEFRLILADRSYGVFQLSGSTWLLTSRGWSNGEEWAYDYDVDDNLVSIEDGYNRQLQLSYIDNSSQFDDGLIWRVGDQTATGLDGSTPDGRYVEFTYTEEQGGDALLTSVLDARGNTWIYDYYGLDTGETEAIKHNLLTEVRSPSVDIDGDGVLDGSITLQRLGYTFNLSPIELAVNGNMEANDHWTAINGAAPTSHNQSNAQADGGTYSWYVDADNGANCGIEGTGWKLFKGRIYTITARIYRVSGTVRMQVGATQVFDVSSTNSSGWQTLSVTEVVADTSDDNCRLQFVSEGGGAEFYVDNVSIVEENPLPTQIVQELGIIGAGSARLTKTFDFQPNRDSLTRETVDLYYNTHHFENGIYRGTANYAGAMDFKSLGEAYRPLAQTDANDNTSVLSWSADGRRLENVKDALGHETSFSYDNSEALTMTQDAQRMHTLYLYEKPAHPHLPTRVLILNSATNLVHNGNMEAPSQTSPTSVAAWSYTSSAPTTSLVNAATDPIHVASGKYALYVNASGGADRGIQSNPHPLTINQVYLMTARVYPTSGNVKLRLVNSSGVEISGTSVISQGTGTWQTLAVAYKATNSLSDVRLQIISHSGAAQFYVDDVYLLDNTIIQQWQEFNYDSKGRVLDEWQIDPAQGSVAAALTHTKRTYYTAGYGNGFLKTMTQEDMAGNNDVTTSYFYDTSGRVIQMNQSSNFGGCTRSRTLYDSAGNVVASICNFDVDVSGTASASSGQANNAFDDEGATYWAATGVMGEWLRYDFGANHEKTITSVAITAREANLDQMPNSFTIEASNDGTNWSTLETVTGQTVWLTRETRVFPFANPVAYRYWRLAFTASDGASNISLAEVDFIPTNYPATITDALNLRADTANPDQNRVTLHVYDTLGRRIQTTSNAGTTEAQTTFTLYDAMGRVIRTITNYVAQGTSAPATWVWDANENRWEQSNGTAIDHETDFTQNLIQDTIYNDRGLVESQRDTLGNVTRHVYYPTGRLMKTIQNYIATGADPLGWYWDATNNRWHDGVGFIDHGPNKDQNIVTSVIHYDFNDNQNRIVDSLGNETFPIYDELNRVVKVVRNAKAEATIEYSPGHIFYDATNDPRTSEYLASTSPDRDLITQTQYDAMGRVIRSYDELGNCTLYGYDLLGRQVRVIRNASDPNYALTNDPDLSDYDDFSINADEDILTITVYDGHGRVDYTQDINNRKTKFVYDGLGRQVKTVQNWQASGGSHKTDPATWTWNGTTWQDDTTPTPVIIPHGTNQDQNIITLTTYDTDGRAHWTQDVVGRKMWHVYDSAGREIKTIANCTYVSGTPTPEDPSYVGSSDSDKDVITRTTYDTFGRVSATIDSRSNETRYFYNVLGRRIRTIANYVAQGASNPAAWVWDPADQRWEQSNGTAITHGTNVDENLISEPTYDLAGRVISTRDQSGKIMRFIYDKAGRRIRTIANYVAQGASNPAAWVWDPADQRWEDGSGNAINHGTDFDLNLISDMTYNHAGQLTASRDARGTVTTFTYDATGRRKEITQADGSPLATKAYTGYDKGGRVLRSVRNWQAAILSHNPDPLTWLWNATLRRWEDNSTPIQPIPHGILDDQNLPVRYTVDKLGRVLSATNPVGSVTSTSFYKDGLVKSTTDPLGVVTEHRYDQLRRLRRVVQAYVSSGYEPETWAWDDAVGQKRWENPNGTAISHDIVIDGVTYNNSANIIADVTLDVVGRQTALRDPRGNQTTYAYDLLNRRTGLTNPLSNTWATAYTDLSDGQSRVVSTLPSPLSHQTEQNFDRLGRVIGINYLSESPKLTPDVAFSYDLSGNRTLMREFDGSTTIRRTEYEYDAARRLIEVGFDTDGNGTVNETVSYNYDQGGLRTQLTLPDSRTITYTYDERGQLVSLTDWDSQQSQYAYDQAGRLVAMERPNDLCSQYTYDTASRLKKLHHTGNNRVMGDFAYEYDARGNRTQALETMPRSTSGAANIGLSDSLVEYYRGTWATVSSFQETTDPAAAMRIRFFGKEATLTLGMGDDHGICDIYVNDTLWQSIDTYNSTAGSHPAITLTLADEGPHVLEIRNRADKNRANVATNGYKLRFQNLNVTGQFDLYNIQYTYDALSRVLSADYLQRSPGTITVNEFTYTYDVAGNITQKMAGDWSATTHNYTYNAANQMSEYERVGLGSYTMNPTYDAAGRMTYGVNNLTHSYTWDRAGRLLTATEQSVVSTNTYNGVGQKLGTSHDPGLVTTTTTYWLDVARGLHQIIGATKDGVTNAIVQGPMGVQGQETSTGNWLWPIQDGLGSVRRTIESDLDILNRVDYRPYGDGFEGAGNLIVPYFNFTGEPWSDDSLLYLRARHYNTFLGSFPNLDLLEGNPTQPLSLNRYAYVHGNPVNAVDPSGNARVKIWAAAFISPHTIVFPFMHSYFPLEWTPAMLGSIWHGDNRTWYDGISPLPVSSRIWWHIEFDTCTHWIVYPNMSDTGPTRADFLDPDWHVSTTNPVTYSMNTRIGKAPRPDPARIEHHVETMANGTIEWITVSIEATGDSGKNPLVDFAPPIVVDYEVTIGITTETIEFDGAVTNYPWHELWIGVEGYNPIHFTQTPQGPNYDASDLFNGSEPIWSTGSKGPQYDFSCSPYPSTPSPTGC